ncbi:ATP/GTP-binding protein [Pedobacter sp. JCM 36344]|uniref:ATP/GTP-binding protein n=1 Tax=Pedobacter sp. JCM 36344 TaxID=3374280 RepID=UPI00397D2DA3
MKKSNFYSRFLVAALLPALMFQVGCKTEDGYIDGKPVDNTTNLTTYAYLKSKPGVYDSLLFLVDKLGLQKTLEDSTVTTFAPSNLSFQIAIKNLNQVRKSQNKPAVYLKELVSGLSLLPKDLPKAKADLAHIDTMVSRYVIRKSFLSSDFSVGDGQTIFSVRHGYPMHGQRLYADGQGWQNGGSEIIEFANTKRSVFVPNWSKTTTSSVNIKSKNGIIHLLRPDHVFGFDEFVRRLTLIPPPTNLIFNDIAKYSSALPKPASPPYSVTFRGNYQDGQVSGGERIDKLFDNNVLTKFISRFTDQGNDPTVITYKFFGGPAVANVYTLTSANDAHPRDPKSWRLEGSLNGTNWVQLDTRQDIDFSSYFETKLFDFPNTVAYGYYRLTILTNHGDGLFQMAEWSLNYRQLD